MNIVRDIIKKIGKKIKTSKVILIVGQDRSGKSELLNDLRLYLLKKMNINEKAVYTLSFENSAALDDYEQDPSGFVEKYVLMKGRQNRLYLIFDDYQFVEKGFEKLQVICRSFPDVQLIVATTVLTQSESESSFMRKRGVASYFLMPFSFGECLKAKSKGLSDIFDHYNKFLTGLICNGKEFRIFRRQDVHCVDYHKRYEEYCIWGGFPEVVLAGNTDNRKKMLRGIYKEYLARTALPLIRSVDERALFSLTHLFSKEINGSLVYRNACRITGHDFRKVKSIIEVLCDSVFCFRALPVFQDRIKEITKNPKIFLSDLGIRNFLIDNFRSFSTRKDEVNIIKNGVFLNLLHMCSDIAEIKCWRTKAGGSVDFVVQRGNKLIPIDVKNEWFISEKISRSLRSFIEDYSPSTALVLTRDYHGYMTVKDTKVIFIPLYYV